MNDDASTEEWGRTVRESRWVPRIPAVAVALLAATVVVGFVVVLFLVGEVGSSAPRGPVHPDNQADVPLTHRAEALRVVLDGDDGDVHVLPGRAGGLLYSVPRSQDRIASGVAEVRNDTAQPVYAVEVEFEWRGGDGSFRSLSDRAFVDVIAPGGTGLAISGHSTWTSLDRGSVNFQTLPTEVMVRVVSWVGPDDYLGPPRVMLDVDDVEIVSGVVAGEPYAWLQGTVADTGPVGVRTVDIDCVISDELGQLIAGASTKDLDLEADNSQSWDAFHPSIGAGLELGATGTRCTATGTQG